jgi:AN1-type zinc finger protein 5/6
MNPEKNEKTQNVIKKKKSRCNHCKCKLGLIIYTCKCGQILCQTHLNPHSHNCSFDYFEEKKKQLTKDNPKLGSKIEKI